MQIFWARLASFGHLGIISDAQIVSKFHKETNDSKEQENIIYTIVRGRETFYRRHAVPLQARILEALSIVKGVQVRRPENSLDNVFLVLNLFYSLQRGSNSFITEKTIIFQGGGPTFTGGPTFSRGVQMLISIETHIT